MDEEIWLPGHVDRETEFVGGLHAACGPNAAAMAERWADQSRLGTLDVYHRMRAAGRCDATGAATLSALAADAWATNYRVDTLAFRQPMPQAEWRSFFEKHVGHEAIVFETANGQALVDALSGKGENARNLHYHFVMVAGWHPGGVSHHPQAKGRTLPAGWWCADGDNFVVGDVLQFYPDKVLAAAQPCAALAVYARVKLPSGGGAMAIPTAWKDDGATLTAPNGVPVMQGFRAWVLGHTWDADDWPLVAEQKLASVEPGNATIGAGTRQDFRMSSLGWTQARGVYHIWSGQDLVALEHQVDEDKTEIADLRQRLAALQQGQAMDDTAAKALAAVQALAEALKEV